MRGIAPFAFVAAAAALAPAQQVGVGIAPAEEERKLTIRTPEPVEYSPAQAHVLDNLEEVGSGFYIHAATGDTVLENDLARLVFGAAPAGQQAGGKDIEYRRGGLIDVATGPRAAEGFQLFLPTTSGLGHHRLVVDSITSQAEANDKASVVVTAHDRANEALVVRTEYLMFNDSPGVLVTSTITNTSDDKVAENVLSADLIYWGILTPFVPGKGWVSTQQVNMKNVEFIYGRHDDQWIMIAPDSGTFSNVTVMGEASLISYGDPVNMEPGEARIYRRWVVVGNHDAAMLYAAVLSRRQDVDHGTLVGRVIEREQAPDGSMIDKAPVANSEVFIAPLNRPGWTPEVMANLSNSPYLIARTNMLGQFQALLPVGDYNVVPAPESRLAPKPNYATKIKKDEIAGLDFGTSKSSRLIYKIVDAETRELIPGKLTVEPLRGTRDVNFGNFGEVRSGNVVFSSYGQGIVDIPSGNYRIVASHGPEYHTAEQRVTVKTIEDVEQVFELRRAFTTPGWVSADIGVRTNATPSVVVDEETRVVSAVAEGVDWLVTGDSNVATDLSDAVARLGLTGKILTSPGYRRSGATQPFIGDFLLFPTNICATGPNPDFSIIARATTGEAVIEAMRTICPNGVILLNRATWPQTGFLTLQGYDRETGMLPKPDFRVDVDAFQIWEGKRQGLVNDDYMTYHMLLRAGNRLAAFGNTNSQGTWMAEPGYPRVYIKSSTDDISKLDPEELALNIKKGMVSVTNGPFVNVKVNGQPMGSLVTDTDGTVDVELEIYAANWVPVNAISVNLNGQFVRKILLNPASLDIEAGKIYPAKDKPEDGRLEVSVTEDSVLDIVVSGDLQSPMDPVNPFNAFTRERGFPTGQFSYAISAPIYVDTDGNGKLDLKEIKLDDKGQKLESDVNDPPF